MPEPKRIPILDEPAPIACTITQAEIPARLALIERLRTAATAVDRTETGLILHLPVSEDVRADVASFVVDETRCCQFWRFAIAAEPAAVELRWDGPPAAAAILDQLSAFFSTDATVDVLDGLFCSTSAALAGLQRARRDSNPQPSDP